VPVRGEVGVFNRSHYEDVLVVRVEHLVPEATWKLRYDHINEFERMLTDGNIRVIKLFLQISKAEQKTRMEERLADPTKQWKFNADDLEKRKRWDDYREAFEAMLHRCSTAHAPWYVIPGDRKWLRNLAVSEILVSELGKPLRFPASPTIRPSRIRQSHARCPRLVPAPPGFRPFLRLHRPACKPKGLLQLLGTATWFNAAAHIAAQ
jgi:hypothetical protein